MRLTDQELQELCNDAHDDAAEEIRELRAQLAAAEARANELNAMLEHCRDEAAETERMLRAEYANANARICTLHILLARYRDETPLGHQPHMIAHQVDKALGRAALAEGEAG